MNLKNPEIFRSWLIRQLEPICKANPEPVSKYVCALLKKEKSDGELKQSLTSQLKIFLESATEEFVNFLVDVLENEKYLTNTANFRTVESIKIKRDDDVNLGINAEIETEFTCDKGKEQRKSPSPIQAPTPSPPRKIPFQKSFSPRARRGRFRNDRRRIATRKSRRDNSSHSDSPLPERRTLGRKRSASASSESSTKSPRRSWITSRSSDIKKYKHRNFPRSSPVGQRSRSVSPKMRKRKPANGSFRKRIRANSRSNSDDDRNHGMSKHISTFIDDAPTRDLPSLKPDLPPVDTPFGQKQRCLDFEGKGYCARGDMCPFDHGPSPIVLDNSLLNGIVPLPPPVHSTNFQDANLYTPQYVNTNFPPKPFRSENPTPVATRELISVPTIPLPQKSKNIHAGKPSYGHIFSSLPPGVSQTTIELTNIPPELNNIPDLFEHFSTFGNLTLIQAKRNGEANTALLTYTNATEAALAFINIDTAIPKAKAAWYADKCILKPFPRKSIPASGQTNAKSFVLNRKSPVAGPCITPTNETNKSMVKKPIGSPLDSGKSELSKQSSATNEEKDKMNENLRQDPGRLLSDLIKKKRILLEKQLASRKEIIEKMKSLEIGSKEEETWKDVLKKLNNVIAENENSIQISLQQRKEYLQKMNIVPMDSAALNNLKIEQKNQSKIISIENQNQPTSTSNMRNEKAEDSELDLPDQIEDSIFEIDVDLSILNQELEDEDDENEPPTRTSNQNLETPKNDENKSPVPSMPEYTRVVVSGFENGDEDELIQHFSQFGVILDKEFDNTIPSATLVYDNRKAAEDAKTEGRNFQDRVLSVTIFPNKKYKSSRRIAPFIPQYEKEYNSYSQYSGNPYKYKNPQMVQTQSSALRVSTVRNVYSYRADPKIRSANIRNQVLPTQSVEDSSTKFYEEDISRFQKEEAEVQDLEKCTE
ncbi:hypothetical protein PGB90_010493 [Kerria lacca]